MKCCQPCPELIDGYWWSLSSANTDGLQLAFVVGGLCTILEDTISDFRAFGDHLEHRKLDIPVGAKSDDIADLEEMYWSFAR